MARLMPADDHRKCLLIAVDPADANVTRSTKGRPSKGPLFGKADAPRHRAYDVAAL